MNHQRLFMDLSGFLLVALVLTGCAGSDTELADTTTDPPPQLLAGLPELPLDQVEPRILNVVTDLLQHGNEAFASSPGALISDQDMVLNAGATPFEYAIYRFVTGLPEKDIFSVTPTLNLAPGNDYWVGLSDYDIGEWAFSGPYTNNSAVELAGGNYLSLQGDFYIALVIAGGTAATVNSVSLNYDDGTTPGTNYLDHAGPFLTTACATCHGGSAPTAGVGYDSYRAAKANAGDMINKIVDNDHRDLSQDDKDLLQAWVNDGMLYGAPVTYTADIQPVIQNRCAPCHTSSSSGGVNLDTFTGASGNAGNALLEILAETMPQSGGPLTEGQKDLWQVWVDNGTPDN